MRSFGPRNDKYFTEEAQKLSWEHRKIVVIIVIIRRLKIPVALKDYWIFISEAG